mmetsp:Transcript_29972/g.66378  ORF Transcript_29972/g.66378 Transcript_29972/m.66378 type:complete len:207 (-) Transcript_29972:598-1218(-)
MVHRRSCPLLADGESAIRHFELHVPFSCCLWLGARWPWGSPLLPAPGHLQSGSPAARHPGCPEPHPLLLGPGSCCHRCSWPHPPATSHPSPAGAAALQLLSGPPASPQTRAWRERLPAATALPAAVLAQWVRDQRSGSAAAALRPPHWPPHCLTPPRPGCPAPCCCGGPWRGWHCWLPPGSAGAPPWPHAACRVTAGLQHPHCRCH